MATFFMFGTYGADAITGISAKRTEQAKAVIGDNGGRVLSMYALLGDQDLALIVEFPGNQQAMKASIGVSQITDIAFSTVPAIAVDEFDKLMQGS